MPRRAPAEPGAAARHDAVEKFGALGAQELLERLRDGRQPLLAPVHDVPALHPREAAHVEDDEAARPQLLADGVGRRLADADPGHAGLLQRLGARDLERYLELLEMRPDRLLHALPRVRALLPDDERLAQQPP